MSAYYAVAYPDRVEIVTDGATYSDDGTVTALGRKAWHSERLPIAFAGRGSAVMTQGIGIMLDVLTPFGSVDWVLDTFARSLTRNERLKEVPIDGVIGSISDAGVPQLHWFTTYDGFDGFDPLKLYDVAPEWSGAPHPTPQTLAAFGFPERMANSTLAESGADLFEAFRQTKMQHLAHPDKHWLHAVGGHVDLTVVRAEGCSTERLRTWPADVIGERIKPAVERVAA